MKLKNQKGISMISLAIAIVLLVIITSMLVYNGRDGISIRNLNNLYNDIESLDDKVSSYYLQNDKLPTLAEYNNSGFISNIKGENNKNYNQQNPNDGDRYYVLDLSALDGVSLNYGRDYEYYKEGSKKATSDSDDVYVINEDSHTIYYPKGIASQGLHYYTYNEEWQKVDMADTISIYTADQLAAIGTDKEVTIEQTGKTMKLSLDGNYKLESNIDLGNICYKVDGTTANDKSWTPIGTKDKPFTGKFNGDGHEISGLYINSSDSHQGLFGYANGAEIENATISGIINTNGGWRVRSSLRICKHNKNFRNNK